MVNKSGKKSTGVNCDYCAHYDWDDEGEYYVCNKTLDEDEMAQFLHGSFKSCPYFQNYDEYKIARKQ